MIQNRIGGAVRVLTLVSFLCVPPKLSGHEGHGTPGSLPAPEHVGGKLGDATGEGKAEIVFEAWREESEVRIEPKFAKSGSEWGKIPLSDVQALSVEVQPSKGMKRRAQTKVTTTHFALEKPDFDIKRPFGLFIKVKYKGENKVAKIPMGR